MLGEFEEAGSLRAAIERARALAFPDLEAYLPVADAPTIELAAPGAGILSWLALAGGCAGIGLGLWIPIWMSLDYPLVVGGKPLISLPPFLVVALELMFLGAGWALFAAFLYRARLPDLRPSAAYRPRFAIDHFGLFLPCDTPAERALAERLLREAGAVAVYAVEERRRSLLEDPAEGEVQ